MNDRSDIRVAQLQAVVACDCALFGSESEIVEDGIHEVARAIAREGSAGSIRSVGAGCKAQDEHPGAGVAEAGNRFSPVGLVDEGAATYLADPSAVGAQAWATFAGNDCITNYR